MGEAAVNSVSVSAGVEAFIQDVTKTSQPFLERI